MKSNNVLMLALALSGALTLAGCSRDATPAVDTAAPAPVAAPAIEPVPAPPPAAPAPMATAPMDSGMPFAAMDKNADGGIALDELATTEMLHQHFGMADSDNDGKLSEAEVDKHRAEMAATPGG